MTRTAGVDWGSNGWVCARFDDGEGWSVALQPSILSVWRALGREVDAPILVDVPIGLLETGTRTCDRRAREFLGSRRNSVFLTPPRDVLTAPTYGAAKAATRELTEHSLTTQAWRLLPRIQEVDDFLQSEAGPGSGIRESHPEVCFRQLAADDSDVASKHESAGVDARTEILDAHLPGAAEAYRDVVETHIRSEPPHARRFRSSNADDILDAMGLAAAAYLADGTFERFGGNQTDTVLERPIELVYPGE
jgi:predicted RNase H-like nuclease